MALQIMHNLEHLVLYSISPADDHPLASSDLPRLLPLQHLRRFEIMSYNDRPLLALVTRSAIRTLRFIRMRMTHTLVLDVLREYPDNHIFHLILNDSRKMRFDPVKDNILTLFPRLNHLQITGFIAEDIPAVLACAVAPLKSLGVDRWAGPSLPEFLNQIGTSQYPSIARLKKIAIGQQEDAIELAAVCKRRWILLRDYEDS
ncbi:hypothetical protein BKA62DRAFT_705475 [Auriculariales sp. MPI-PUGE-AT-0066]|nr:hypothetical protein BKA62DRAFT_705475 [Auriculariales sp. MPI-PUGE-AT-0066]